ncbi:MAG: hypothetical protein AAF738_09315, partial [Bacteroidota bacterium]
DASKVVYVTNEIGNIRVYLYDVEQDRRRLILKQGFRNPFQATDYEYPLVAWSPNGNEIAILYEKRDQPKLLKYTVQTGKSNEEELIAQFQRVHSMTYLDARTLALSATVQGFSDVFLYYPNTRQSRRITRDYYDDLDVQVTNIGNTKGLIWSSNRPDTALERVKMKELPPINTFDLFYVDISGDAEEAVRITHTPFANERQAVGIDTTHFAFLSDESGIYNRVVGHFEEYIHHYERTIELIGGDEIVLHADSLIQGIDSTQIDTSYLTPIIKQRAINHYVSNLNTNLIAQRKASRRNKVVQLVLEDGKHRLYVQDIDLKRLQKLPEQTVHRQITTLRNIENIPETINSQLLERIKQEQKDTNVVVPEVIPDATTKLSNQQPVEQAEETDYFFQSDYDEPEQETAVSTPPTEQVDQTDETIDYENFFQSEYVEAVPEEQLQEVEQQLPTEQPPQQISDSRSEVLADFELPSLAEQANPQTQEGEALGIHQFRPGRITPYRLRFRSDILAMQLSNELLFGGLNSYSGVPADVGYPPPGILTKANFKDLLEDYEVEGGVRFPTTFGTGAEYYLVFDDKKKRLDKQFAFYRRAQKIDVPTPQGLPSLSQKRDEVRTVLGQFGLRYPLDVFRSLRLRATLRSDSNIPLASDST